MSTEQLQKLSLRTSSRKKTQANQIERELMEATAERSRNKRLVKRGALLEVYLTENENPNAAAWFTAKILEQRSTLKNF